MNRLFAELCRNMSAPSLERSEQCTQDLLPEIPLVQLRQARKLSNQALADVPQAQSSSASKLEGQTDMYISTLRNYIEAMGGTLEIVAHFPDGSVNIASFSDLEN